MATQNIVQLTYFGNILKQLKGLLFSINGLMVVLKWYYVISIGIIQGQKMHPDVELYMHAGS